MIMFPPLLWPSSHLCCGDGGFAHVRASLNRFPPLWCDGRKDHHKVHCYDSYTLLGWDVQYPYTADLMLLNFCSPPHGYAIPELEQVSTPLHPDSWEASLAAHSDRAYVQYICQGLREGFRVGFHWDALLASATRNMHSTTLRPAVISEYIGSELAKGRMLGPFPPSWKRHLHINRFGLIPKGHNTGKYRLITD